MRVPRREHRSVAVVPLGGTCLASGLSSLVLCDEAVLPGVRLPEEIRPIVLMYTVRGQQTYHGQDREVVCTAGSLNVLAGGNRWSVTVDGDRAHHSLYISGNGAWFSRLEVDLASTGGIMRDPAPPAAVATAMQTLIRVGVERPAGWDWAVLAAFGCIASHVGSVCQRGGGTLVERLGRLIDQAPDEAWRLERAASALGLGLAALNHRFRGETGEGPASWIRRRRMDHARRMLGLGQRPSEVAAALGFPSLAQFSRSFHATVGRWPSDPVA